MGAIRLTFSFTNVNRSILFTIFFQNINRGSHFHLECELDGSSSGLQFGFFPKCKSDGGHENVNRMTLLPVYILKKIINQTRDIRYNIFLKKTEDLFGHFYRNNFDIFKTYESVRQGYWSAERICQLCLNKDKKKHI